MQNQRTIRKVTPFTAAAPAKARVAAYARVSSDKDAMLHSLSAQVSHYSTLIQARGDWEYRGVYADEALTGTKAERPGFQSMLVDCRAGKIDLVLTKSLTRFARNTVTMLETLRELKALGIDVWFEKEKIHSMSGDGELMLTILASYSQEESRSASENCKWRLRKNFSEGKPTYSQMLGYRQINGVFIVIPEEAKIVRRIFAEYLGGDGKTKIARRLFEEGVPTKRGGAWTAGNVDAILKNEKYVGDLLLQKTFVSDHIQKQKRLNRGELPMYHVADAHEAIIEKADFDAVQAELLRRRERHVYASEPPKTYPLTGLVRCGICGKHYRRKIAAAGSAYEKPVWICATFNHRGKQHCPSKQIPEDVLERTLCGVLGCQSAEIADWVREIVALPGDELLLVFPDGQEQRCAWQNPSRRESWTEEMRQRARQQALDRRVTK